MTAVNLLSQIVKFSLIAAWLVGSNAAFLLARADTPANLEEQLGTANTRYPTGTGGQTGTGTGTRLGPCSDDEPALTALVVPSSVAQGVISPEQRTFWFYVPYKMSSFSSPFADLKILDQSKTAIHQAKIPLTATAGIVRITVPNTVSLQPDQRYRVVLSVSVHCTPDSMPEEDRVAAWVQVRQLTPDLKQKLALAKTPQQKATLYEQNGFWYDALTILADTKRKNPANPDWAKLLRTVQLEKLATEPIVDCCN